MLSKIPSGIVLQTHLQSFSLHVCTTRNKLECTLPWTSIMHVCFQLLQITYPNINPYDKKLLTSFIRTARENIKPLTIKVILNL